MIRVGAMLLEHFGFNEVGGKLHKSLDICGQYEKRITMTGRDTGATSAQFGDYLMNTLADSRVESRWEEYVNTG